MLGLEMLVLLGVAVVLCGAHRIDDIVLRQVQARLDIEEIRLARATHPE